MNERNLAVKLTFLTLGLLAPGAVASVIDVPGTAPTIQAGINMAMPGDTVMVAAGIYLEHISLVSNISVIGVDPATTVIDGGGANQDVVTIASRTGVVFSGFTVRGAISGGGLPGGAGVFVNQPTAPITIQNCRITGNDFGLAVFNGFGRTGPDVLDCELFGNNFHGLYDPGNGLYARNLIYGNSLHGISISGNSCSPTLDRNTVWGNTQSGFHYWNDFAATLTSNIFANNGTYGIEETAPGTFVDPAVQSNLFFGNVLGNYFDVQTMSVRTTAASIDMLPGVSGTIVADPLLCAPPMDFGLGAGSPAIGAGLGGVDVGARGLGCASSCVATGPMTLAAGDVQIDLDLSSGTGAVDLILEYATDMGVSWVLCAPSAASPIATNPATAVPVGTTSFLWDTITDGIGFGATTTDIEVRARITSVLMSQCVTAPFDVRNLLCGGLCGDCDQNGLGPTVLDALTAAQIAAGLLVASPGQAVCCDINSSSDISVLDALGIAQVAAGLPVVLSCP